MVWKQISFKKLPLQKTKRERERERIGETERRAERGVSEGGEQVRGREKEREQREEEERERRDRGGRENVCV